MITAAALERRVALLEAIRPSTALPACTPVELAERADLPLHDYQADLLRASERQLLLNWSRQSGKSSVTAMLALHQAYVHPGSLTLILSPSERQSRLLLVKMKDAATALHEPGLIAVDNQLEVTFANGSQVFALPGNATTLRGFSSVGLLIVDEAARTGDDLYHGVRPMLAASGGRLILLSTPFGRRGFFHREWVEGGAAWHRSLVPVTDVPHIDPAFLEEEQRSLPPELYAQEYLGQFCDTVDQLFTFDLVQSLITPDVEPLFGGNTGTWPSFISDEMSSPLTETAMVPF